MGFYTKYFSTLLRGVRATAWKERIEAGRAVRKLRKSDKLYQRASKLVKEHRVTSGMKKLKKTLDVLGVSAHNADNFIFNVLTEDKALVKTEQQILQALLELSQITPNNNPTLKRLEKDLAMAVLEGTKYYKFAEPGEREEYKQVLLILNEAKGNRNKFMAKLNLMFQKQDTVSMFSRFPMKSGASREKTDILKLQHIAQRIKFLKEKFKQHLDKEVGRELMEDTKEIASDLKDAFYDTYTIKKRGTMLILKILYDLHSIGQLIDTSVEKHYLPKEPSQELILSIKKTENEIVQDFQIVAQGFRIVIAAIEKLDKEAESEVTQLARAA